MKEEILSALKLILVYAVLTLFLRTQDTEGARERIIEAVQTGESTVSLWEYDLYVHEAHALFQELYDGGELPCYVDGDLSCAFGLNGLVKEMRFSYLDISDSDYAEYERTVAEILDQTVYPGMSQMQVALALHDYLVVNCGYDETYTYFSSYDALVRGTVVCNGYARAYQDLLLRCGIECRLADSVRMDHAWNLVKIDGEWYHVDVTWDDPVPDRVGRVYHNYFLLSDEGIADEEHGHYGWKTDIRCEDASYDDGGFWKELSSAVWYADADGCYLRRRTDNGSGIFFREEATGAEKELYHLDRKQVDIGDGPREADSDGLTLYRGGLYFTDVDRILRMDPAAGQTETVLVHDVERKLQVLKNSFVKGDVLYVVLADSQGETAVMGTVLPEQDGHIHSYTAYPKEATCGSIGYTDHRCDCGLSYRADIQPADGEHSYVDGQCPVCGTPEGAEIWTLKWIWETAENILEWLI